ncbi:MAG: hypothetical protein MJ231_03905 [bacterium]|nr:hypothetical protein [bacterium]
MGMDGLSMANTGAIKESTSADFASRTEQTIQADPTNDRKQVQNTSTNRAVREKDEDEESPKQERQAPEEEFEDGLVQEEETAEPEEDEEATLEDIENPNKDFYVKLNSKSDTIELYDSSTDRLIETISGNELGELVKKLNMASGIFVNKKV